MFIVSGRGICLNMQKVLILVRDIHWVKHVGVTASEVTSR